MRTRPAVRPLLSLLDQVFSSLGNALVLVALARVTDPSTFGLAALAFLCLTASLGVARGVLGTPVLLASASAGSAAEAGRAATSALVAGFVLGAAGAGVSVAAALPAVCLVLSLAWPVVLLEDVLRYGCIATRGPRRAVVADGLWMLGSAAVLGLTFLTPVMTPAWCVAGWLLGGVVGLVTLLSGPGAGLRWHGLVDWWLRGSGQRLAFGAESALSALSPLATAAIVTAALGAAGTGALRGASTFTGPIALVLTALPLAVVPHVLQRSGGRERRALQRLVFTVARALSPLGLVVAVLPWLLPSGWGRAVLGATWPGASVLLPFVGFEYVALAWMHAASTGLRALGRAGLLLRLRLGFVLATVTSAAVTVQLGDLRLVCLGAAVVAALAAVATVLVLLRVAEVTVDRPPAGAEALEGSRSGSTTGQPG